MSIKYQEYEAFFKDVIGFGDEVEIISLNVDHMICVCKFPNKPLYEVVILLDEDKDTEIDLTKPFTYYHFLPNSIYVGYLHECNQLFDCFIHRPKWNVTNEVTYDSDGKYNGRIVKYKWLNTIHELMYKVTFKSNS